MDESKYSGLISKIKRKRRWVIALTLVGIFLVLLLTGPIELVIMGESVIDYPERHPVLAAVLIILCIFAEFIACGVILMPLTASMEEECDPEKQIVLYKSLYSRRNFDHIYAVDYFYLGDYTEALKYTEKMLKSSNKHMILVGLFDRARCEFFLENYDAFRSTVSEYKSKLSSCQKMNPKVKLRDEKIGIALDLMYAISENDTEKINELRNNVEVWNNIKATEGFVNYIKGIAAYNVDDKEEATYRFKFVKENCSKTVLAGLSENYLSQLKQNGT